MSAVQRQTTTRGNRDGEVAIPDGAYGGCEVPLTGFSVIETNDLDEVIQLAAWAPCSKAEEASGMWTGGSSWDSRVDLILRKLEARKETHMTRQTSVEFADCYSPY